MNNSKNSKENFSEMENENLKVKSALIHKKLEHAIKPNSSWSDYRNHYLNALTNDWYRNLCELQNLVSLGTMEFYKGKNIGTMHLPLTTGSISSPMGLGSDSCPVKVNLCGIDTYLADSMQFMLEYGCRIFEKGCYYIMPSFRGENADERHLCQFYHSEVEIPGKLQDVKNIVQEYLIFLCNYILSNYEEKLFRLTSGNSHVEKLISLKEIPSVTFDDAERILEGNKDYIIYHKEGFRTITREGEQKLIELFDGILWLTHFDELSVPFYQASYGGKALNADLLFGIGEVVGSGERHGTGEEVGQALKRNGVERHEYKWYIKMKEKFPMKTSGFGMGIERFLMWLTDNRDIRDFQLIPRFNGIDILP